MNESENIFDISPEIEEDIITQATSIIVEDFLLLGRDIPEGFTSIAPVLQIVPIKLGEKINGDTIGAVRYAFRKLREYGILEQISHVIQMVRELVTPDEANVPLTPTTYERIFEQIVTRLRFSPVHTRRAELEKVCPKEFSEQIVEVYFGFSHEFEENPIGSFSKDIPLNRNMTHDHGNLNHETLSEIVGEGLFYDAREAVAHLCGERFDLFLAYFKATSSDSSDVSDSSDFKDIVAKIKHCFEEISDELEKINRFRPKNPTKLSQLQQDLNADVESFRDLENIFKCSPAEENLLGFLPKGLEKAESYLFDFDVTVGVVFDKSLIAQKQHIYQVLQERKLLLYYFAHTAGKSGITQLQKLEIIYKLQKLSEEIRFCMDNYGYELLAGETTVESFCDISFVGKYLPRIQSLLGHTTALSLWHLSSPLNDLVQICKRFISQIGTIMSDGSLDEIEKKAILANYHRIFYGHLVHLQITIQDIDDPVINKIREICETIKEHTRHKEIDS